MVKRVANREFRTKTQSEVRSETVLLDIRLNFR